jgi:hypothetical protein
MTTHRHHNTLRSRRAILTLTALLAATIGCTDADEFQEFSSSDIKPADAGAHQHSHEHHDAPHQGDLVALGDHQYHAEITWDEKNKTITVYVLDGEAANAVPIAANQLVLTIGTGDDAKQHTLAAQPQDGDGKGKASRFQTTDKELFDSFHDNNNTTGHIQLPIGKDTFPLSVTHDDHDHDHDHKHDDDKPNRGDDSK